MVTQSFKELLIIAAKEIYDETPTQYVKTTLNKFLATMKILNALLIKDSIGIRSVEQYEINNKYVAYIPSKLTNAITVIMLDYYYNEVDNIENIDSSSKFKTIKEYIKSECQL